MKLTKNSRNFEWEFRKCNLIRMHARVDHVHIVWIVMVVMREENRHQTTSSMHTKIVYLRTLHAMDANNNYIESDSLKEIVWCCAMCIMWEFIVKIHSTMMTTPKWNHAAIFGWAFLVAASPESDKWERKKEEKDESQQSKQHPNMSI